MTQTALGNWFPSGKIDGQASRPSLSATLWRVDQEEPAQAEAEIPKETFFVCAHLGGGMRWNARFADRVITDPAAPGTSCIAKPGEVAMIEHSNAHATFMHFHLDFPQMCELLLPDGIDLKRVEFIDPCNAVDQEIDAIARRAMSAMHDGMTTRLHLDSAALALTAALVENWSDIRQRPRPQAPLNGCDWRIRRVVECIESNLCEDWDLGRLALEANLSPSHLVHLFRTSIGLSPHAFLMDRRVKRGCELLRDRRQSVTDIALSLGFSSSQHFATVFRKHVGMPPSQFRKGLL